MNFKSFKYVIGVDGGNSKTHYALFNNNGEMINFLKGGTTSHELFKDSFAGLKIELEKNIKDLISKNNLSINEIEHIYFGLAGTDTTDQYKEIKKVIREIGIKSFTLVNDAYLGIKAGIDTLAPAADYAA